MSPLLGAFFGVAAFVPIPLDNGASGGTGIAPFPRAEDGEGGFRGLFPCLAFAISGSGWPFC